MNNRQSGMTSRSNEPPGTPEDEGHSEMVQWRLSSEFPHGSDKQLLSFSLTQNQDTFGHRGPVNIFFGNCHISWEGK